MASKHFDPKMIEKFQKAIVARDVMGVWNALDNGIVPSTQVDGHHPLELLLYGDHSAKNSKLSYEQFHQNGSEIVELLLSRGVKLVEEEKHATANCDYLVDRFLASKRLADLSTVVIHALSQSLEENGYPYEPDINGYIANYLDDAGLKEGDDLKRHITNALKQLESVHEIVQQRLEFPETAIEKDIVLNHNDKLDYWMHKFERPKLRKVFADLNLGNPDGLWAAGSRKEDPRAQGEEQEEKNADSLAKILPKKSPQQVLAEMNKLVGMSDAKDDAQALWLRAQFDAACSSSGLPVMKQGLHTVFEGNPGTGKTTMARHRAELLHALGLVGNRYVEISRENMVGQYIGQTEKNMVDLFNQADVIFIDEAYNLAGEKGDKKDYGNRVIDALMTALENRRDTLTVFFAGYPEEMRVFIDSNPGLRSRITHYQHLPDYSTEELGQIMDSLLKNAGLKMEAEAREYALQQLEEAKNAMGPKDFGNARIVRTLVEQLPNKLAVRLFGQKTASGLSPVPGKEVLTTVRKADIEALNLTKKLGVSAAKNQALNRVGFKGSWMKV